MPRNESQYPLDWLRIANKDLQRVEYLLKGSDAEAAGIFLQQAVEKYLKAYLLFKGWKLKRTHDLEILLNEALNFNASFEPYRDMCQKITAFYFEERYPFIMELGIDVNDVRSALDVIKDLIEKIKCEIIISK